MIPIGDASHIMTVIVKKSEKDYEKIEYSDFQFVPFLRNKSWGLHTLLFKKNKSIYKKIDKLVGY